MMTGEILEGSIFPQLSKRKPDMFKAYTDDYDTDRRDMSKKLLLLSKKFR